MLTFTHRGYRGCLSTWCAPSRGTSSGRCGTPATPPRAAGSPAYSPSWHRSGPLRRGRGLSDAPLWVCRPQDEGLHSTCRQHQVWLDDLDGVGAELLKVGHASGVSKPADVNVGHLEADVANTISRIKDTERVIFLVQNHKGSKV